VAKTANFTGVNPLHNSIKIENVLPPKTGQHFVLPLWESTDYPRRRCDDLMDMRREGFVCRQRERGWDFGRTKTERF